MAVITSRAGHSLVIVGWLLLGLATLACTGDAASTAETTSQSADRPSTTPIATPTSPPVPTPGPTPSPTVADRAPTTEAVLPKAEVYPYVIARERPDGDQIPVHDEPGGISRTLIDVNDIDGARKLNPLFAETSFGQPLVLRLIDISDDDAWFKVQVPTRPNHSHAWVRATDFDVGSTNVWIEASVPPTGPHTAGELWVYRDGDVVFSAPVASGRDSRPTPLGTGWVGQFIDGPSLSPAYGPWIVDLGRAQRAMRTTPSRRV